MKTNLAAGLKILNLKDMESEAANPSQPTPIRLDAQHWKTGEALFEQARKMGRESDAHRLASWGLIGAAAASELFGKASSMWDGGPSAWALSLAVAGLGAAVWSNRQQKRAIKQMAAAASATMVNEQLLHLNLNSDGHAALRQDARALARAQKKNVFVSLVARMIAAKHGEMSLVFARKDWTMRMAEPGEEQGSGRDSRA